ncbi:hypothetical protein [Flavimarina sp. Hel_I_48]|uniref:hypothetical protein n=1 Tax=Flavimarina sp. Hel_I_48 TaxID=1392488 RepID=UPI000691513A|nr:hypothetical protein [Flavimarina sp. Hel_I_48]
MIKYLIIGGLSLSGLNAQENRDCDQAIKIYSGDELEIAKPSAHSYKYINLPRANFLKKRGGIKNFNKLSGEKIKVTEVTITENCKTEVRVKRKDGKKFFNTLKTISIDLDKALETGEVKLTDDI